MTLEQINYFAQTLGVVAILGSFIALLIQMRQTNRLLRNQAKREQIAGIKSISEAIYQTPGLADLIGRSLTEGFDALPLTDRILLTAYLTVSERTWEALHLQYMDGQVDESLWQSHLEQSRAVWNSIPATRGFWAERQRFFTAEYQAFHKAEIESGFDPADAEEGQHSLGYSHSTSSRTSDANKMVEEIGKTL
jgi:hypothetical protein